MLLVLLCYFAVVVYGCRFSLKQGGADYLSIENTQAVKGIFILMVFLSHFNSYVTLSGKLDNIYLKFFQIIGQAMVAMFLFYSGYGVMESIKRKGSKYISAFPRNRLLVTLFNFDCAVLLYLILALCMSKELTVKQVLLSFIGWDSIGNSNWYIFVILLLYLITYIVFKVLSRCPHYVSVIALGAIVCILIFITNYFNIKELYWYDTALCYVFGMAYSLFKQRAEGFINKNIFIWLVSFAVLSGVYFICRGSGTFLYIISNVIFSATLLVFTMRVTFKNKFLIWCGKHLFEIYILQRIPMIIFSGLGLQHISTYLYFFLSFAATIVLVFGFSALIGKLHNIFFRTEK